MPKNDFEVSYLTSSSEDVLGVISRLHSPHSLFSQESKLHVCLRKASSHGVGMERVNKISGDEANVTEAGPSVVPIIAKLIDICSGIMVHGWSQCRLQSVLGEVC